jgi:hypothetical protein
VIGFGIGSDQLYLTESGRKDPVVSQVASTSRVYVKIILLMAWSLSRYMIRRLVPFIDAQGFCDSFGDPENPSTIY